MAEAFQRARSPEQKALRRAEIVAAAGEMLDERLDASALSLNELAKRAGMAKSNVYRYFESREDVLLTLLEEGLLAWSTEVAEGIEQLAEGSVERRLEAMVERIAALTAARPRTCHLVSVLPSVLEHNLSMERVRDFKGGTIALTGQVAMAMHAVLPELEVAAHGTLLHHAFTLIVGGWPLANPADVVCEALRQEGWQLPRAHLFEQDLREAITLMARGLLASSERQHG